MSNIVIYLMTGFSTVVIGLGITVLLFKGKGFIDIERKQKESAELIEKKKEEAEEILKETKERVERFKKNSEDERSCREERIKKIEESLEYKEENANKKEERVNELKLKVEKVEEEARSMEQSILRIEKEIMEKLTKKTNKTEEEFKEGILKKYIIELDEMNEEKMRNEEENLKENSIKIAKNILIGTIQRLCSPTSVETKSILIKVPKDQIKGKIVGKGGKNIKHFEELLDVSVVFNDLPQTISISGYNLVIRRIAQKAMEKLVRENGGIDEKTVERAIKQAEKDMDEELYSLGKDALNKMGMEEPDKELTRIIGRLQYRTSYGQNIMKHSMEVAWVATMLGSELEVDTKTCRIAGFLHDLGKAIDQDPDVKDAHDRLTKELMEKYGYSKEEVHAAWSHHDAEEQTTPEALLVKAADAVSAGRPGARQESIHGYLERIKALESTAKNFEGVDKAFAISAGRELRILVNPQKIKDKDASPLAKNVAKEIEENIGYPGKIKVNVIRRVEHTEIIKKEKVS